VFFFVFILFHIIYFPMRLWLSYMNWTWNGKNSTKSDRPFISLAFYTKPNTKTWNRSFQLLTSQMENYLWLIIKFTVYFQFHFLLKHWNLFVLLLFFFYILFNCFLHTIQYKCKPNQIVQRRQGLKRRIFIPFYTSQPIASPCKSLLTLSWYKLEH